MLISIEIDKKNNEIFIFDYFKIKILYKILLLCYFIYIMEKLNFKKLTLKDKPLFDKYFKKFPPQISEYSFTNLYVWQKSRIIEYTQYEEGLIILATTDDEKYFLSPIGFKDNKKIINYMLEYGQKNNITNTIKRVSEEIIKNIKNSGLNIIEDRDNFDYVYNREDLAFLKGRKFSNKRGFIKKFCANYYHRYWSYNNNKKCRDKCLKFTDKWFEDRKPIDKTLYNEHFAIKEFLNNYNKFNSIGGVICIEDEIIAYSFGEKLNKNTFVVHFEKGDPKYTGVYQTINKLFVENDISPKFDYINREQDLGISGIRKAKQSYNPAKLIKKFNITI